MFYLGGGGGIQPHFCPWKNVCFPIFSHGEKWEKSIWKEREMNTFPFLSIYFFSHFSPWGKWENTHFSMGINGVGPPFRYSRFGMLVIPDTSMMYNFLQTRCTVVRYQIFMMAYYFTIYDIFIIVLSFFLLVLVVTRRYTHRNLIMKYGVTATLLFFSISMCLTGNYIIYFTSLKVP